METQVNKVSERIEGDKIVLNGQGPFPKTIVIHQGRTVVIYRLIKTRSGGFILNK